MTLAFIANVVVFMAKYWNCLY